MEEPAFKGGEEACNTLDPMAETLIKEERINIARDYFKKITAKITEASTDNLFKTAANQGYLKNFNQLVSEEVGLRKRHHTFQTFVGVAGSSGAGKSSAINAWLDIPNLLPSSCQQAATAVVCLVSWNYDTTEGHEYRAEIDFHTTEEIRQEINEFYETLADLADPDNPDTANEGLAAAECIRGTEQIDSSLHKINAVWGKSIEQLQKMTADTLWASKPRATEVLGTTKHLHYSQADKFANAIRPYLDSTETSREDDRTEEIFAFWPLVKSVRIFVRAEILKHGIVLVDLPGLDDMNSARVQVAKSFFPKLALTVIVAPIIRAADETTAHELLDDNHEIRLRIDGKYNAHGVGFVLSKIDDINVNLYLKQPSTQQDFQKAIIEGEKAKILALEISQLVTDLSREERKLKQEKAEKRRARAAVSRGRRQAERKRITEGQRDAFEEGELFKAAKRRKKIAHQAVRAQSRLVQTMKHKKKTKKRQKLRALSLKLYYAIKARNNFSMGRIQQQVAERQRKLIALGLVGKQAKTTESFRVIPMSSARYWEVKEKEGKVDAVPGFFNLHCTGIPQVREWIVDATKAPRHEHLDALLQQYENLNERLIQWSCTSNNNEFINATIEVATESHVESCLASLDDELFKGLASDFDRLGHQFLDIDPLRNQDEIIQKHLALLPQIIERWFLKKPNGPLTGEAMLWHTFEAILRRGGEDYRSRQGIHYKCLSKFINPIMKEVPKVWTPEMNEKIPALQESYVNSFTERWDTYQQKLALKLMETSPVMMVQINRRLHCLDRIKLEMVNAINRALKSFKKGAAASHPKLKENLQQSFQSIFREALQVKGRRSYDKRRRLIREKAVQNGRNMLDLAFKEVRKKLDFHRDRALEILRPIPTRVTRDTKILMKGMIQEIQDHKTASPEPAVDITEWKAEVYELASAWKREWKEPKGDWAMPKQGEEVPEFVDEPMPDAEDDWSDSDSGSGSDDDDDHEDDEDLEGESKMNLDTPIVPTELLAVKKPRIVLKSTTASQDPADSGGKLEQLD